MSQSNNNITHFLRTGVGVDSIRHLHEIQSSYRRGTDQNGDSYAWLTTRGTPKRANDLINGGSVYWIIKRQICARQDIIDIQTHLDDNGRKYCLVLMNPQLYMTAPIEHKHIQGWRYLPPEKAPQDLRPYDTSVLCDTDDLDPQMARDLAASGLL